MQEKVFFGVDCLKGLSNWYIRSTYLYYIVIQPFFGKVL